MAPLLLVLLILHAFACISCASGSSENGEKIPKCSSTDDVMTCVQLMTPLLEYADPLSQNLTTACKTIPKMTKVFTECLIQRIAACKTTHVTKEDLETINSFATELCTEGTKTRKTAQKTLLCLNSSYNIRYFETCEYTVINKLTGKPTNDGIERFCCSLTEYSKCNQAIAKQVCGKTVGSLVQRILRWGIPIFNMYCEIKADGSKRNCDQYTVDIDPHLKII